MFQGMSRRLLGGLIVLITAIVMFTCMYFKTLKTNMCIGILCAAIFLVATIIIPQTNKYESAEIINTNPDTEILSQRPHHQECVEDVNPKSILGLIYKQPDNTSFKDKPINKDI
jgi:MFS superfamily sulfate permease-like transporter